MHECDFSLSVAGNSAIRNDNGRPGESYLRLLVSRNVFAKGKESIRYYYCETKNAVCVHGRQLSLTGKDSQDSYTVRRELCNAGVCEGEDNDTSEQLSKMRKKCIHIKQ